MNECVFQEISTLTFGNNRQSFFDFILRKLNAFWSLADYDTFMICKISNSVWKQCPRDEEFWRVGLLFDDCGDIWALGIGKSKKTNQEVDFLRELEFFDARGGNKIDNSRIIGNL